jgi:hypothetical protein
MRKIRQYALYLKPCFPLQHTVVKKKTPEPVFEAEEELKPTAERTSLIDEKCDYCLLTEDCNRNGEEEDLLVCKDCNAKGTIYLGVF